MYTENLSDSRFNDTYPNIMQLKCFFDCFILKEETSARVVAHH